MTSRAFRFGLMSDATAPRDVWQDSARRAEDQGFDVVLVADHLDSGAPLPALMSAGAVTTRIRLGTIVLNSGFYRPALLTRDAAGLHRFTDARFDLGLGAGAGFAAHEFAAAELPFPSARDRVDHLEHTVREVRRMLAADGHDVPVMVAGQGDRVLGLAARHADIVNIARTGGPDRSGGPDPLRRRVEVIRSAAGHRFDRLELSLLAPVVHVDGSGEPDLGMLARFNPGLSGHELLALPGVLRGSVAHIVEELHRYRAEYGVTYFTIGDQGHNRDSLAAVIDGLR